MKLPLLSSTETSTVTVTASAVYVATPSGSPLFFLNSEGILDCLVSAGALEDPFLGRATVSLASFLGP